MDQANRVLEFKKTDLITHLKAAQRQTNPFPMTMNIDQMITCCQQDLPVGIVWTTEQNRYDPKPFAEEEIKMIFDVLKDSAWMKDGFGFHKRW